MNIQRIFLPWEIIIGGSRGIRSKFFLISCSFWKFLEKNVYGRPLLRLAPPYENPGSAPDNYRPLSEASEGYVFRSICLSNSERVDNTSLHPPWPGSKVTTYLPPKTTPPSLPLARVKGHNSSLPRPGSKVTTPPSPRDYARPGGTHPTGMHLVFVCVCLLDLGQTRNIRKICELAYSQNKIGHQVLSETCWPCKQIQRWKTW